jgi:hypothetical protein
MAVTAFTIPAGKDLRDTWQWQCLMATRGTVKHMILRAAMHNNGQQFPRFAYRAEIMRDGMVHADFALKEGELYHKVAIDQVDFVRDAFRRLADKLKLCDKDRAELFELLRSWMEKDHRAISGVEGSDN